MVTLVLTLSLFGVADVDRDGTGFFENRIRPLLVQRCYGCHSKEAESVKGGLLLDSRAGWVRGGDGGDVLVPGSPDESRLILAVRYEDPDIQMPPRSKLARQEIADLTRWVELGAPDPRRDETDGAGENRAALEKGHLFDLVKRRDSHWAWQPVASTVLPAVRSSEWPRQPLDHYILARLESAGIEPNSEADKRTFIRRVSFDLLGLAPTPAEIHAFLADKTPTAHLALVDRLLGSPYFGEHWGQHWFDLMRYAETWGHEGDDSIPHSFRYRHYVIGALNGDLSYDRLVVEHLAGDLLRSPRLDRVDGSNQSVQGTGFWHFGEQIHSPVDLRADEAERRQNQIDVFSKTFLGMSMGCARCHDHKFDAISMRDYYAFYGFLQSSAYQVADVSSPRAQKAAFDGLERLRERQGASVLSAFVKLKKQQLQRFPRYLVAALEVANASSSEADPVAARHGLDARVLRAVTERLQSAVSDPGDVLHLYAVMTSSGSELANFDAIRRKQQALADQAAIESRARESLEGLQVIVSRKVGETNYVAVSRDWKPRDLIIDYASSSPTWITNGYRFGRGPLQEGEVLLGTLERPIESVVESGSAWARPLTRGFTGLLRTQNFEVTGDTLWYRLRGKGKVNVIVDSWRNQRSPIHNTLRFVFEGEGRGWRWMSQDLRNYVGKRVHIEFSTVEDGESFAINRVLFSDRVPEVSALPERMLASLKSAKNLTALALAERFSGTLFESLDTLNGSETRSSSEASGHAKLINWINDHGELFEPEPELERVLREELSQYHKKVEALEGSIPEAMFAVALFDGTSEDEPLHLRGNTRTLSDDTVPRRLPAAIAGESSLHSTRGSGRLEMAQQLVSGKVSLVPRVMVNRIWHHLFSRGIVESVDDFGVMGKRPSHPALIDHLAERFMAEGWSIKRLIRTIVLSATYRMSSRPRGDATQLDPNNELVHRMPIRRLHAEAIRDHCLAVSGRLEHQSGGLSVRPYIPAFTRNKRSPGWNGPVDGNGRRSVYIEVRRNHILPFLLVFDRPSPFMTVGRRRVSNAPAQPLVMLNDSFIHDQAAQWARRLLDQHGESDELRVVEAYLLAFGRPPSVVEKKAALSFIEVQTKELGKSLADAKQAVWASLCHTLMNVKEFIFLN